MKSYSILILILLFHLRVSAQHNEAHEETSEFKKHHLSILAGVAFVPAGEKLEKAAAAGLVASESVLIVAPTIGLEYEYLFNHKWWNYGPHEKSPGIFLKIH